MRLVNKKNWIIYLLMSIFIIYNVFFAAKITNINNLVIAPLFYLGLTGLSYLILNPGRNQRKVKDKIEIILIIMLIYIIIYFVSGLFFTYAKSIYSFEFWSIIKNIWIFFSVIVFKELIRNRLVKNTGKSTIHLVIITLLFILSDVVFTSLFNNISSAELLYKYSFQVIVPSIFLNIVCTYLCSISDYKANIIYRIILITSKVFLPIVPNLDWFLTGMFEIMLAGLIFIITYYYENHHIKRERKRFKYQNHLIGSLLLLTILVFFGLFVGGFFRYRPVAVVSGSMDPVFKRGDAVIIRKYQPDDFKNLENGVIIAYRLEDRIVLHRIIKVYYKNGEPLYQTKGDNNDIPDKDLVEVSQIQGVVKFRAKYVGYPSVLLNEYFNKK